MASSASEGGEGRYYYERQPVVICEIGDGCVRLIRPNKSYLKFARIYSLLGSEGDTMSVDEIRDGLNTVLYNAALQCEETGQKAFFNEMTEDGDTIHGYVTRIADNPVRKVSAYALVISGITPKSDKGLTFTEIAKTLSVDYIDIYQVDMNTDRFIEYTPDNDNTGISIEKRGGDFFASARRDALTYLHEDDRDGFVKAFTKENIVNALDEYGVFNYTYRANFYGDTIYVNMKALRMTGDKNQAIFGVSNIDAQMRERETLERLKEEQATYSRISVLMGDFIAIYTVDPETGTYMQYSSSKEYSDMGTSKFGTDFFKNSIEESAGLMHPDDYDRFTKNFTKERVLEQTKDGQVYIIRYRLKFGDGYMKICLRAGRVKEKDGMQLIVGVGIEGTDSEAS